MGFLKNHGEKLLLILLLAGLAASVLSGLTKVGTLDDTDRLSLQVPESSVNLEVAALDSTLMRLTETPPQVEVAVGAFTPEIRVMCINQQCRALIHPDVGTCVYCGEPQTVGPRDSDGDGITDRQEISWGMDPTDPNDVFLDPDGDGFPTLYEFEQGTDPTSASSTPELISFLRLQEVDETSIRFELRGTAKFSGNITLQLSWTYPGEQRDNTGYVRTGQRFGRNNEFLLESFTEKRTLRGSRYVDESVAVIRSGRYRLELGRTPDSRAGSMTERRAVVETIFGPELEKTVRVDETIRIGKKSYKVVDITEDAVVLKSDVDSDSDLPPIRVERPTPEDEEALEKFRPEGATEGATGEGESSPGSVLPMEMFN